jgi:hypothetical protein
MTDDPRIAALKALRRDIPRLAETLHVEDPCMDTWTRVLDLKLFPRVDPDFPLIAAICGGGSTGKSTLFNSLIGDALSPVGGRAGMNRRVLMALPETVAVRKDFLFSLYAPFGSAPEPLVRAQALLEPGNPLYITAANVPENLILLDTPDFDTGSKADYVNRKAAQNALETADMFIYIFTNSNYNNRGNTDFVSRLLTGIGMRKAFFVYRVYSNFSDAEVLEHAMTAAVNIYGKNAEKYVLGVYRADEDNAVASGKKPLSLTPVHDRYPSFHEAVAAVHPVAFRKEVLDSVLADAARQVLPIARRLDSSRKQLARYKKGLKAVQETQVRTSLRHFPMDRVLKRFAGIWMAMDPPFLRTLRKTGAILEIPFGLIVNAARWLRPSKTGDPVTADPESFAAQVESDLLNAAHELFTAALAEHLFLFVKEGVSGNQNRNGIPLQPRTENASPNEKDAAGFEIPAHPVIFSEQAALSEAGWHRTREAVLARKERIVTLSARMDQDLITIARDFRKRMSAVDRVRQLLSAAMNVLPATVAVTYILHTGDPVGAVGIKVKLAGLLGAKDLYALIAIPATAGLKAADMKQLQEVLEPLARAWLEDKHRETEKIFEDHITGGILEHARQALSAADSLMETIRSNFNGFEIQGPENPLEGSRHA